MRQGLAVIPTAPEHARNRDSHYPYRFDSYFYYLTGFPGAGGGAGPDRRRDAAQRSCSAAARTRSARSGTAFATGPKAPGKRSASTRPIRSTNSTSRCRSCSPTSRRSTIDARRAKPSWDARVIALAQRRARPGAHRRRPRPAEIRDVRAAARRHAPDQGCDRARDHAARRDDLRRRASARDALPRGRACTNTKSKPSCCTNSGATARRRRPTRSIVAGGANACVLHYVANNRRLKDGDLLLIDAGCELDGYASDITRTFPVERALSAAPQRDVYELVLAAQAAAIAAGRPGGQSLEQPHDAAVRVLAQGHDRSRAVSGQRSTASSNRAITAASTCIAPAIGWAWTCTTPAITARQGNGARCSRAWC